MAFVNEYVPPIEQETSEFLRWARTKLKTGYSRWDLWTVDRDNDMVLCWRGGGHGQETHNIDYWSFIDREGEYSATTQLLSEVEISVDEIALTLSILFQTGKGLRDPGPMTIKCVKEAFREYKDLGAASRYTNCRLTMIDSATGEEI